MASIMSLADLYTSILRDPSRWSYYSEYHPSDELSELFGESERAKDFIHDYFEHGNKGKIVEDIDSFLSRKRAIHTISTFFLGIALEPLFDLRTEYNIIRDDDKLFLWLWFMTCLYHDMGYKFENDRQHKQTFSEFILKTIEYNPFYAYSSSLKGADFETIEAYYNYRRSNQICDHGITGGLLLYDRLLRNYNQIFTENFQSIDGTYEDFIYNGRHFSTHQWLYFAKCANAIMQHNIWFQDAADENKRDIYHAFQLDELLYTDVTKPHYKDKLTALLVFCDSIEPLKRFECCKPWSVLHRISIDINNSQDSVDIHFCDCIAKQNPYTETLLGMQKWTNLIVSPMEDGINIHQINKMYQS